MDKFQRVPHQEVLECSSKQTDFSEWSLVRIKFFLDFLIYLFVSSHSYRYYQWDFRCRQRLIFVLRVSTIVSDKFVQVVFAEQDRFEDRSGLTVVSRTLP